MARIPKPTRPRRREPRRTLAKLREHLDVSQSDLGRRLGISQAAVLKTERAADPQISTVRRYVEALGAAAGTRARLRLEAVVGSESYEVVLPEGESATTVAGSDPDPVASLEPRRTVWRLRAWDDAFLEHEFLGQGVIAISNDEIGPVQEWPGDEGIARRLRTALPERSPQAIGTFVRYWRDFRLDMQPGDTVVVPMSGRRAAIGVVTGEYSYNHDPKTDTKLRHRRAVDWLGVVDRSDLDDDLRKVVNAPGTICRIGAPNAAERLVAITTKEEHR